MKRENTPTLYTERLVLRKFAEDDAQSLFELLSDKEVNTFLPWFPLTGIEQAGKFLQERFLNWYAKPSAYRYAVCLRENNRPIGYVWLSDGESGDFGYGLKKEFQHRGIITEAAQKVVERLKDAGLTYITATHDAQNPASGAVMQKLGMSYKYSYVERWQPKNIDVTFRMYQLNLDGNKTRTFMDYWNRYGNHFIEEIKNERERR